ncbi:MAG: Fic family protein [Sphaerospermopsis sp. SIO1G2]|nr:Fic family protein [Sphaerospermopsis sp. SIO1G2]
MIWNWQQKDWPNFRYDESAIAHLEKRFLQESGLLRGAFTHFNEEYKKRLTIELISVEALKTSEIEGEHLNRDSVQSSIRRHFGLQTDNRKIPPAEQGIAEMMLDLHEHYQQPLAYKTLFNWHEMLCNGRRDLQNIGAYRSDPEPMEIISGPLHKPTVHFEAPPSTQMKCEMDQFVKWFNESEHKIAPLTRAAIAHLYFVCIHPFEDGNGRISRALAEKSLAQELGYPTLIALSKTIESNKKHYYEMLATSNQHNEITEWVVYFANVILDAQTETQRWVEFLIAKAKFFDRFDGQFNKRQEKAIIRLFEAGPDGFEGGLSASNYQSITGAPSATATRDLADLVQKEALRKTGELKHTRYWLNLK